MTYGMNNFLYIECPVFAELSFWQKSKEVSRQRHFSRNYNSESMAIIRRTMHDIRLEFSRAFPVGSSLITFSARGSRSC